MHRPEPSVCQVRVRTRSSGRLAVVPVLYARAGGDIAILADAPEDTAWWRNFTEPYPVDVRLDGRWLAGIGRFVLAGHPSRPAAVRTYRDRFPQAQLRDQDLFVVITLLPQGGAG
jgi:hypothetical protein